MNHKFYNSQQWPSSDNLFDHLTLEIKFSFNKFLLEFLKTVKGRVCFIMLTKKE